MFALSQTVHLVCVRYPGSLLRTQLLVAVNNQAVLVVFFAGHARDPAVHGLLVDLFHLQSLRRFWLCLPRVPTEVNSEADRLTLRSSEELISLHPQRMLYLPFGAFTGGVMAKTTSTHRASFGVPGTGSRSVLLTVEVVLLSSGLSTGSFACARADRPHLLLLSPPPVILGPVVQHLLVGM